jgi:hypothetical protein
MKALRKITQNIRTTNYPTIFELGSSRTAVLLDELDVEDPLSLQVTKHVCSPTVYS